MDSAVLKFKKASKTLLSSQRHSIGTTSVQYAHWFLKEMSEEVNQVITAICEEQCMLADKVVHGTQINHLKVVDLM